MKLVQFLDRHSLSILVDLPLALQCQYNFLQQRLYLKVAQALASSKCLPCKISFHMLPKLTFREQT